jgi:hypothetical protein
MGVDRVFEGEIRDGFRRYRLAKRERGDTTTVSIEKKKRMHKFGHGYLDRGGWRSVTFDMTESEARAVRDLLDDWLDDD